MKSDVKSLPLLVRGPYKGYSGHDCTVRSFVRYLVKAGARINLQDLAYWSPAKLTTDQRDSWFDQFEKPIESNIALHFCMPHQVKVLADKTNVNFTMFEASRIPEFWLRQNQLHDLVIVPTESSKRFWCDSGFPEQRVRICPLGVDSQRFRPTVAPLNLTDKNGKAVSEYRVRVLNISEIVTRKNLLSLLRVWIQATHQDDDAILIIKLNHSPASLLKFLRDLTLMEKAIGKDRSQAASILFTDQVLTDAQMPALYTTSTHYWSMSFGEGWDQPMTEAGASGLRLIAPDHTAYQSYLDNSVARLLPCRKVSIDPNKIDKNIRSLFQNAQWWQADEEAAAAAIQQAIAETDQPQADIRQRLNRQFNWTLAAQRLLEIVNDI